jgi:hypothetical protein
VRQGNETDKLLGLDVGGAEVVGRLGFGVAVEHGCGKEEECWVGLDIEVSNNLKNSAFIRNDQSKNKC